MRPQLLLILFVVCVSAAACGGSSTDEDPLVTKSSTDGVLTISVPAADLDGDLVIEESDVTIEGPGVTVLAAFQAEPDGSVFDEPGTITFSVSGVSEAMSLVAVSVSDAFGVEVLDTTIELAGGQATVTAPIEHFSTFALAGTEQDLYLAPESWDMNKGDWRAVQLNVFDEEADIVRSMEAIGTFELSSITTTGALGDSIEMTVSCIDVGPSTFRVLGTLMARLYVIDDETGIPLPFEANVPVDEQGSVGCRGSVEDLVADDVVPRELEVTDRRCVAAGGTEKEPDECPEPELEASSDGLALRMPEAQGPFTTASINFVAGDGMLGLACDGRDPATFEPLGPGEMGSCRLLYFADGVSGTQILVAPELLPSFTVTEGGLAMSDAPIFDVDDTAPVLVIPDDTSDVSGAPVAAGRYVIDSLMATMQPVGEDFSVVQVNLVGFGDFVTAARSSR